jgi:hypothetical protein
VIRAETVQLRSAVTVPELEPGDFLRTVVDPLRLQVLACAAIGITSTPEVSERCHTSERNVIRARSRLASVGLLDEAGAVRWEVVRSVGERLATNGSPVDLGETPSMWSTDEAAVLGRFLEGTRLISVPTARTSRQVVLDYLVQRFDPGVRYAERDINFQLQLAHHDYAALRRYLVDDGFMTRADGVYWRTGGRYLTAEPSDG